MRNEMKGDLRLKLVSQLAKSGEYEKVSEIFDRYIEREVLDEFHYSNADKLEAAEAMFEIIERYPALLDRLSENITKWAFVSAELRDRFITAVFARRLKDKDVLDADGLTLPMALMKNSLYMFVGAAKDPGGSFLSDIQTLELLYDEIGFDVNAVNKEGENILMYMCKPGNQYPPVLSWAKFFIEHGVNIYHKNNTGQDLFDLIRERGRSAKWNSDKDQIEEVSEFLAHAAKEMKNREKEPICMDLAR